jgi:hypothetical protein
MEGGTVTAFQEKNKKHLQNLLTNRKVYDIIIMHQRKADMQTKRKILKENLKKVLTNRFKCAII